MHTYTGVAASTGIVVGPVEQIDHGTTGLHRIVCDPFRERALYDVAVVLAKDELRRLSQRAKGPDADILLFQIALLEDESFTNEIGDYIAAGAGGAAAVERAEQIFAGRLKNVDDEYIRERSVDVCDVCRRVVDILDGRPRRRLHLKRPSILVADRFFPSDLFSLDRRMVLGLASDQDSTVSHAAIMARSMGIPAVVQLGGGTAAMAVGHRAILDADNGTLIVEPDGAQIAQADCKIALSRLHGQKPDPVAALPCLTKDGTAFPADADLQHQRQRRAPYARCGGHRPCAHRDRDSVRPERRGADHPSARAAEKRRGRARAAAHLRYPRRRRRPLGRRDAGPPARQSAVQAADPALLRAATDGDLRVVFPMIKDVADWDRCVKEVNTCRDELLAKGRETGPMMLGCVVDMPSAAVMAGDMMEHGAQLMAVDIEDLTRYTLGLVQNPTAAVNQLTNPAVLRLVSGILEQAQERGAQVYLCGITVAAVDAMPTYLKLGIRTFSAEPAALLPLKKLLMEQELTQ